jgi:hypothetical protein
VSGVPRWHGALQDEVASLRKEVDHAHWFAARQEDRVEVFKKLCHWKARQPSGTKISDVHGERDHDAHRGSVPSLSGITNKGLSLVPDG